MKLWPDMAVNGPDWAYYKGYDNIHIITWVIDGMACMDV